MTHAQAQQLALELMTQHGLIAAGWRFRWSHGKNQLGVCQVRKQRDPLTGVTREIKTIKLSRHLVALNSDEEVRDTILHEIAHALAGLKNGHNHAWREICRRIGATPRRVADKEVKVVAARYSLYCGCCQRDLAPRHRRTSPRRLKNFYCRTCGPRSKGRLELRDASDKAALLTAETAGSAGETFGMLF